ncbi:MAG: response regulator [Planctomycetota bacterium]
MGRYKANFKKGDNGESRRNSLGLDKARLHQLLDLLDTRAEGEANLKRVHVRWPFRHDSVTFRLIEGFGSRREFKVAARNLSNSGLSLIHNAYVHPMTQCEIRVPISNGEENETQTVKGTIRRCTHIQGVVHEIGVEFDEPVDARQFLSLDSMEAYYSLETIDLEKMEGTVLHVEDSAVDRRLFTHYLADTRVIVKSAETVEEAKQKVRENFDLVVVDLQLPDGNGIDFVAWMRDNGILTPTIAVTADGSHETQRKLAASEINGCLTKPVDPGTLQRAITEYLRVADDRTSSDGDGALRDLAGAFIAELGGIIEDLRTCLKEDDAMTAYSIVLRMKGTAPALGFTQLANVCNRAASALAASMSCEESQRQLDALLDACDRLRHRRAA